MNEPYKDSIILVKDSVISTQMLFIDRTDSLIMDFDLRMKASELKYLKMRKSRRNSLILGGCTTLTAFIVGIFLVR